MDTTHDITGTIWAVFGHRFALDGKDGRILADLGPKGAEAIALAAGDTVSLKGVRKPSEIKVTSLALQDGSVHSIDWPKKPHEDRAEQEPTTAIAAVTAQGYAVDGEPKRKPKHFEIIGSKNGNRHEIHVDRDGTIRKIKPLPASAA